MRRVEWARRIGWTVLLLSCSSIGCDRTDGGNGRPLAAGDRYHYSGYDREGRFIRGGWLQIRAVDATGAVAGLWHLERVGTSQPGELLLYGDGDFLGRLSGNRLRLDLNPGFADNNGFLDGVLEGSSYQGDWSWVGFIGQPYSGPFVAIRE